MDVNTAHWPIEEREQGKAWEDKCEEMGGDPFVNSRQLQCVVGDKELRIDKKTGDAVLESKTERLATLRDVEKIEGDPQGLKVSKNTGEDTEDIRLEARTPNKRRQENDFRDNLIKAPQDMRPR